ncbi:hypothetical protein [Promicromonospora soli]|uniref:Uncharacterized protein n=1 Tax=Promicromonospora soli TaxID=2035533 RepID=A0A919KTH2_9MICO|nr:hypothetical protein [Promicromonospora soli]GHH71848.1 hypothetical protein GCM10017772_20430 [Promicromonospora soli]
MSGFGKWNLGIGLVLVVVALICRAQGLIPATVILSIVGLLGLGMAAHDVVDNVLERADLRHRAARVKREREREGA